ncbi:MAG: single-stranded DNA-binding protein [Bacteroidia bacterium]|nr:single-stranded DNA-binding protein [Bacteroidia bacterium]
MGSLNKVLLIGNLGKDPEIRNLENGATVAHFSIATTEYYKDKSGNRQDQTEWHNIVAWRNLAELSEKYLKKGMQVHIEGRIKSRNWEDKEGKKHYQTEILADDIIFLDKMENSKGSSKTFPVATESKQGGDLPF